MRQIDGNRIYLRPIELQDVEAQKAAINISLAELSQWMIWAQEPATTKTQTVFIKHMMHQMELNLAFEFGIFLKDTHAYIGEIGTHDLNWMQSKVSFGYWLRSDQVRKGYVTEASVILLEYLFLELKFHRVEVDAAVENTASLRVIEKLGFAYEGTKRQAGQSKRGVWHDLKSHAMLYNEYKTQSQTLYAKYLAGKRPKLRF
jgi:RimJ/RimL family protein N-acetyltransferase